MHKMRMISIGDRAIDFHLDTVVVKNYTVQGLQFLEDQLVQHYCGQSIRIHTLDGENLYLPGFYQWFTNIQRIFNIPNSDITVYGIAPGHPDWMWERYPIQAFDQTADVIDCHNIDRDLTNAKFVGALSASRPSWARLRMIYQLDQQFTNNTFLTFEPNYLGRLFPYDETLLTKELDWIKHKVFDNDCVAIKHDQTVYYWPNASKAYEKIWNQFWVEIVMETDEYQNSWFTDKIARCLWTGKPFLLLSGKNSLSTLKSMGFQTFESWIDESYDRCELPAQRIRAMINSLQQLYLDPLRDQHLAAMQKHAANNHNIFIQYLQSLKR